MGKRRGLHSRYYHTVLSIFDGVVERAPARGIALLAQLHAVATSRLHNIILNPPLRLRSVTFHRIANDGTTQRQDTQQFQIAPSPLRQFAGYRSNGQIACRPAQSSISNNMDLFANLQQQPQSDVEQSWQSESRQMTRDEIMLDL